MAETPQPQGGVPPQPKSRRGCKIAAIVGAVILIIVIIGGILICTNIEKIGKYALNKGIDVFEGQIIDNLPEDYDVERVERAFEEFRHAIEEGKIKGERAGTEIQALTTKIQSALADDELTTEEVDEIIKRIEDLAN